jgi:predicted nucleic acid-binding Zn ribbon protein
MTVQLTLDGKVYYDRKCRWCGKGFNKKSNNEQYCSDKCRHYALLEQKAKYQRKRRKLLLKGVLISNSERNYLIGTNFLSARANPDFDKEYHAIRKEMARIGI